MGRRDAVQVILEVVARMRALDPRLVVTYEPGWETRGNGTTANYEGGIWHHTASASSASRPFPTQKILRDGRPDLSGPLCNFAAPWSTAEAPRLHVMAANPANHAGASGGPSMGTLTKTSLFNPRVLGLEIDYAGSSPMSAGQARVARLWGRAVSDVVGGHRIESVRGHAETSVTGKWDPGYASGKTLDLAALRRDAAALTEGEDMPTVNEILDAPIQQPNGGTTSLRMMVSWSDYHIDLTRKIITDQTAAVINGLLDAPIDRADLGLGSTNLRAILTWSDTNTDRVLNGIAALTPKAASAGEPLDEKALRDKIRGLVTAEIQSLRLTVSPPA